MYPVSATFLSGVYSGAKQRAALYFSDAVFDHSDIAMRGGLQLTEPFCAETDLAIGLAPSASLDVSLLNREYFLDSYAFGEFSAYIGVYVSSGTYTPATGELASMLIGAQVLSIHADAPYVRLDGSGLSDQPSFAPKAILAWSAKYSVISASGAYYSYDASFNETSYSPNAIMANKGIRWAAVGKSVLFDETQIIEYDSGNYDTYELCPLGTFYANEPAGTRKLIVKASAHDKMSLFDADILNWYNALTWPLTLEELYIALCAEIGVTIDTVTVINGDYPYAEKPFETTSLTGRALLKYIAQASCSIARITRDGEVRLDWFSSVAQATWDDASVYTWDELSIFTWDHINEISDAQILLNGIALAKYQVSQIDKLRILSEQTDVGVTVGTGSNAYVLLGAPLIGGDTESEIEAFCTPIYNRLALKVAFTPISAKCVGNPALQSGDIINITYDETEYLLPIYTLVLTWNGACRSTLVSTGNKTIDEPATPSVEEFRDRQKALLIEKSVDGLTVTATDNTTRIENNESQIALLAESITQRVTQTIFDAALADKADNADIDSLYESIMTQTAQDISYVFNILQGNVNDVSGEFDAYKSELTTYLRILAEGILEMGRSDSNMTMQLTNTQLSFLQSGVVLAYFANNKMYVTEAEMDKATIAGFEWAATTGGTGLRWRG